MKKIEMKIIKLLASAPTKERVLKLISEFWGGSNITITPRTKNIYYVSNSKGIIRRFHVIEKGKRWRFVKTEETEI